MPDTASFRFDVFLSHASEDKQQVRAFARQLEAAGMTVWLDEEQLPPGVHQLAIAIADRDAARSLELLDRACGLGFTQGCRGAAAQRHRP